MDSHKIMKSVVEEKLKNIGKNSTRNTRLISHANFVKEYRMVTLNFGRQMGHTQFIVNNFNFDSDVVVSHTHDASMFFRKRVRECRIVPFYTHLRTEAFAGSFGENFDYMDISILWIDCYSMMSEQELDICIEKFNPELVVGLG